MKIKNILDFDNDYYYQNDVSGFEPSTFPKVINLNSFTNY